MKNTIVPAQNRRKRSQKGSAMMEFALGSTMLMLFLFGTADFGRLFYASIEVQNAAAAGANYAAYSTTNLSDTTGISNAAKNEAADFPSISASSSEVCQDNTGATASCTTAGAYHYAKVITTYTFNTLFSYPLLPSSVALTKTVMMRTK